MVVYALPGIFVMGCLVCLMESYVIRCPEQSEWNIRAGIQCKNITDYFCLYNYIYYTFEEGCTGPEWDIPGRKRVYSRNFNTAPCRDTRFQPIIFVTNGNSDCIFRKSLCTEEGQTLFTNGTTRTDSTCRCDYTQGYAYVTVPRNTCYCRPSEEDCSCYLKKCKGVGYNLSADYECTNDITKKTDCPLISANASEDQHIDMAPTGTLREDDAYVIRRKFDVVIVVLVCIFGMIVITMCFMFHQRLPRCPQHSTKQDGIRLEEIVSGNNEDYQIALKESDELKNNIGKEGLDAALKRFNEVLDNWRDEPVNLAVTGTYVVGKSFFINAICNLKSGDPDFAALSSSGNSTKHATVYEYPGNANITLYDLPVFGNLELPTNGYEKTMNLRKYDYILIFVRYIEKNDVKIAKKLIEMKKPFCFVVLDIQKANLDGELEIDIVDKILSQFSGNLKHAGFNKGNMFVISNHNRRICQFNALVSYIQRNLPGLKCDALMFSILGELSCDIIDSKYKRLKKRLLKVSVASFVLATIIDMNEVFNIALICKELLLYRLAFGFEQQFVKDILKDDSIRQKLNANSIIETQATDEAVRKFVIIQLKKLRSSRARENPNDTFRLLNQILDGCRDDAKLIYSHMMHVDDHRDFDNRWRHDIIRATYVVEVE